MSTGGQRVRVELGSRADEFFLLEQWSNLHAEPGLPALHAPAARPAVFCRPHVSSAN